MRYYSKSYKKARQIILGKIKTDKKLKDISKCIYKKYQLRIIDIFYKASYSVIKNRETIILNICIETEEEINIISSSPVYKKEIEKKIIKEYKNSFGKASKGILQNTFKKIFSSYPKYSIKIL